MIGLTSHNLQTQKTEPLSRAEQYDLILQAKAGNQRALRQLIDSNQGLIRKEANRHKHQVDLSVLMAAGEMAVFKAVQGFDLSTGNRFSTYAVPAIHSEIRDCVCRETGVGRTTMEHLGKISRASTDLTLELGREPTLEEIAEHSGLSQQQVTNAWEKKAFSQPGSLNQKLEEGSVEWLDLLADHTVDIWSDAEDDEILETLDQLESEGCLEDRQIQILITKDQGYSNREVGRELGVSGERVRQLIKGATKTIAAFVKGTLKPVKPIVPVADHPNIEPIGDGDQLLLDLPVPEAKPVVKWIDATRLGSNLDDQILEKQIQSIQQLASEHTFGNSHCSDDWTRNCDRSSRQNRLQFSRATVSDAFGEVNNAEKPILVFCRSRSNGLADRPGHQSASTDQQCHRLGQARKACRGCLEVGQVISTKVMEPFASAYQCIRGFGCKLNQWRKNLQLSTAKVFDYFGIGHREDRARPPTEYQDEFSLETNHFSFGGLNMNFAHKRATAWFFGLAIFTTLLCWGLVNDNWSQTPEFFRPFSSHDWSAMIEDSRTSIAEIEEYSQQFLLQMMFLFKLSELAITAGWVAWSCGYLALSGMNLIQALPSKDGT